ncbi:MAG TPA: hypothetical protein VF794_22395 [Archangium sp.]|jgi:hypothetical protein|uniref:hypothetical protein n=1 Tax=Archangium sp. TaxID=1872627 RepID=UPI002EDABBAE
MSERRLEDPRRQLEGGLEVLEATSVSYRALSATLQRRGWKKKLRREPELIVNALAQELAVRDGHVPDASGLGALLAIRRHPQFRAAVAPRATPALIALVDMFLVAPGQVPDSEDMLPTGSVVLRPGFIISTWEESQPAFQVIHHWDANRSEG